MTKNRNNNSTWNLILIIAILFALVSTGFLFSCLIAHKQAEVAATEPPAPTEPPVFAIMESFDSVMEEKIAESYNATVNVKKAFWIPDSAEIAPKPNESCYGETDDPSSLQWLLDESSEILNGQELVFSTDTEVFPGSTITYYLDESIFVITWQEVYEKYCYTFSEVKISHPSQFRRYLAGNEYDSDYSHSVSKMCNMTNAVLASSADFYRGRNHGIIVYQGQVKRTDHSDLVDTCFIDRDGNLILVPAGEIMGMDAAQQFVDEHNIDFSLAFGPILINNGERCDPDMYYLGEINKEYPRAALCQKDDLHYILVFCNKKGSGYAKSPKIRTFTDRLEALNCKTAYTLDGGKTGTVSMRGKHLNSLNDSERWISDIIYFATAIPSQDVVPETTAP